MFGADKLKSHGNGTAVTIFKSSALVWDMTFKVKRTTVISPPKSSNIERQSRRNELTVRSARISAEAQLTSGTCSIGISSFTPEAGSKSLTFAASNNGVHGDQSRKDSAKAQVRLSLTSIGLKLFKIYFFTVLPAADGCNIGYRSTSNVGLCAYQADQNCPHSSPNEPKDKKIRMCKS